MSEVIDESMLDLTRRTTPPQTEENFAALAELCHCQENADSARGEAEAVWPPELEAALIEALEIYEQESIGSRDIETGRFSMRNRFVSGYILEVTGKARTPEQVNSRLQQLRDTCEGDLILQLISRRGGSATYIHVLICLQKDLRPCPVPAVDLVENDSMNPHVIKLSPRSYADPKMKASACSILSYLSGTVEYRSSCRLALESTFHVYVDGSDTPLHSEMAPLKCLSSGLYSSELAPDFWNTLCSTDDPRRYTIIQSMEQISNSFIETNRLCPLVFVAYNFDSQGLAVVSYGTTMVPSTYPIPYPASTSTYNSNNS